MYLPEWTMKDWHRKETFFPASVDASWLVMSIQILFSYFQKAVYHLNVISLLEG